jgi:hypothetical protein
VTSSGLGAVAVGTQANAGTTSVHTEATALHRAANQAQEEESRRLDAILQSRRERNDLKLDFADVLTEMARLAAQDHEYAQAHWFDTRAAAVRDCANVRVLPHLDCPVGGGAASPISCHVRGEPDCERVRVRRLVEVYVAHARRAHSPKFVTLTTRNVARGELARGLDDIGAAFTKLRRRTIFAGGPCRNTWPARGPGGELDGAPMHPCHVPEPHRECPKPRCAPGCRRGSVPFADHGADCERGCPTRTGLRQSHCRAHPPRVTHPDGCPPSCEHADHRRDRNCPDFAHRPVLGGISATDLTFNEAEGSWHPHSHSLLDGPYVMWAELSNVWRAITCTTPGCRHERLPDGSDDPTCTGAWMVWLAAVPTDDEERLVGAVREVLKYVAKPHGIVDSLDPERIGEYLWALRGRRTVAGWGSFADVSIRERCPMGCPPDCPKAARKWCEAHDCPNAHRSRCMAHRPLSPDLIEIEVWSGRVFVPKCCPSCGQDTDRDDWSVPFARSRLESFPGSGGRYGWKPPRQPAAGVPSQIEGGEGNGH